MGKVYYARLKTRIGEILLASADRGVCQVCFPGEEKRFFGWLRKKFGEENILEDSHRNEYVIREIEDYIGGKLRVFKSPMDLRGTPFQISVWEELCRIPYGKVRSYGDIATRLGRERASRAVGGACGANPVPIMVPCHRVIASDGSLGGFGGGLELKRWLLALEGFLPALAR